MGLAKILPDDTTINKLDLINTDGYGICTGSKIIEMQEKGLIDISGFNKERVNPNSYNLTLCNKLLVYDAPNKNGIIHKISKMFNPRKYAIDPKLNNLTNEIIIPDDGYILKPGVLYLGKTNEFTTTTPNSKTVPMIDGRSSIGRLGIYVHITAGFGDVGFNGNWTLELSVVQPVIVYPDMEICQISYYTTSGDNNIIYNGKYQNSIDIGSSKIFKEFEK